MEDVQKVKILSLATFLCIIFSIILGFGPASILIDEDRDGIYDWNDNCPSIENTNQADNDISLGLDGGNSCDDDDDNDGTLDINDAFPFNELEDTDTDNDDIGNNADLDDDNDGTLDVNDAFPLNKLEDTDTDNDNIGNNADLDDDDDGISDNEEILCGSNPLDISDLPSDFDSDDICDLQDFDDDNDGWTDLIEISCNSSHLNNNSTPMDDDNDGICNGLDLIDDSIRLPWEIDLLFDTCNSRLGDWIWPQSLSEQDQTFLYPGELRCDWEYQGLGDSAVIVIYNRGVSSINLNLEITSENVGFSVEGGGNITNVSIDGEESIFVEIEINNEIINTEEISIISTNNHTGKEVILDIHLFPDNEKRTVHAKYGDYIAEINYKLWDDDTGELLDEGSLQVTAGDDWRYIEGFGWGVIGLDIDDDKGYLSGVDTSITQTILLPPPIAYGNTEGHELEHTWLRFELKISRF